MTRLRKSAVLEAQKGAPQAEVASAPPADARRGPGHGNEVEHRGQQTLHRGML